MIIFDQTTYPMAWVQAQIGETYDRDVATIKTESGMRLVYYQLLPYEVEGSDDIDFQWTPIRYNNPVLDS